MISIVGIRIFKKKKEKAGKKYVSKGVGTCDSSFNELFTRG